MTKFNKNAWKYHPSVLSLRHILQRTFTKMAKQFPQISTPFLMTNKKNFNSVVLKLEIETIEKLLGGSLLPFTFKESEQISALADVIASKNYDFFSNPKKLAIAKEPDNDEVLSIFGLKSNDLFRDKWEADKVVGRNILFNTEDRKKPFTNLDTESENYVIEIRFSCNAEDDQRKVKYTFFKTNKGFLIFPSTRLSILEVSTLEDVVEIIKTDVECYKLFFDSFYSLRNEVIYNYKNNPDSLSNFIEIIERLRPIICDTYGFDFYFGCVALEIRNVARICPDTADVLKNYF